VEAAFSARWALATRSRGANSSQDRKQPMRMAAGYPTRWLAQSVDRVRPRQHPRPKAATVLTILLIIVVLLLLFGGFGYSRRGRRL
jgi:hypothetical protein